jgi:hypothetical protein
LIITPEHAAKRNWDPVVDNEPFFTYNPIIEREIEPIFGLHPSPPEIPSWNSIGNRSFFKIDPKLSINTHGSMFFYGTGDLDTMDLRHIIDCLLLTIVPVRVLSQPLDAYVAAPRAEGVRINCIGHIKIHGHLPIEKKLLPLSTCNDTTALDLVIGMKIGIPLVLTPVAPGSLWQHRCGGDGKPYTTNDILGTLLSGDGFRLGTMVAVRRDKKSLLPAHVQALFNYVKSFSEGGSQAAHWMNASKEGFAQYYKSWVEEGGAQGPRGTTYETSPGPYEV